MSRQLQPSVPLVTLVKPESPTVIKNEAPEEASEKEISPDIKNIDIVYHSLSEDLIKNETAPENILETKYSVDSVETQVLVKTEDTSDENVTRGTNQEVIEVQGSHEHSNTLSNLETHEQLVLNSSKDLNGIHTRSRKAKHDIKTDLARCYKTDGTTSWEKKYKDKIKVIKAPVIPVEAHEYTFLSKDEYVCNHCQHAYNKLGNLKLHISKMHREVTTMYQCSYCSHESKWDVREHIIQKHSDIKDIQWFQCNLCEMKFKLRRYLARHIKVHLRHKQMKNGLDLREKSYHCDNCDYKTYTHSNFKRHKLVHLKLQKIEYFYCYHCSFKSKKKFNLKNHIFGQHFKNVKQRKRYYCDKCDYETYASTNLKKHKLTHLKPEEIQCYYCPYKAKQKRQLKVHIFKHFKKEEIHLKPEEIQYFYCYHCSYKAKQKRQLKDHIFKHFKNEEIRFHCYICDFVGLKRYLIIGHIRKHFKNRNKYDETISKYQLESRINNGKKRFPNNLEHRCSTIHFVSKIKSVPENSSKSSIFQCTYCPTKFPEEHLLKGHLQLHSSTKGIKCPICTYRHNKTEILKHLSWHGANGNDSFICSICNLKKRSKENMDDHLKVVHSKAIYQKHDSVCKNKTCNGFC